MTGIVADSCGSSWSPIVAAGPQSALSGVLAGFVFTGIVVVLSTKPDSHGSTIERHKQRSYALQLFTSAFITLALDSYFTSITAGELSCNRANVESALSGGVLGIGAIMLLAGLGWLLVTYSERTEDLRTILIYVLGGVWALIIAMLAISAMDIGQAMLKHRGQGFVDIVPWAIAALMTVAVIVRALASRRLSDGAIETAVRRAALAALAVGLLSALLTGIASATPTNWWSHPPSGVVDIVIVLSMAIPAIALIASVPPAVAAVSDRRGSSATGEPKRQREPQPGGGRPTGSGPTPGVSAD